MLISRKVTEVSEISHVNLRARLNKIDKSFQFFFGTVIYVAAKKVWLGTVELIENLFFYINNK